MLTSTRFAIVSVAVTCLLSTPISNAATYELPAKPNNPTSVAECANLWAQSKHLWSQVMDEAAVLADKAWEIITNSVFSPAEDQIGTREAITIARPYYDAASDGYSEASSLMTRASGLHVECMREVRAFSELTEPSSFEDELNELFSAIGTLGDKANPKITFGQSLSGAVFDAAMAELQEHFKDMFRQLDEVTAKIAEFGSEPDNGKSTDLDFSGDLKWIEETIGRSGSTSGSELANDTTGRLEVNDEEDWDDVADTLIADIDSWNSEQTRSQRESELSTSPSVIVTTDRSGLTNNSLEEPARRTSGGRGSNCLRVGTWDASSRTREGELDGTRIIRFEIENSCSFEVVLGYCHVTAPSWLEKSYSGRFECSGPEPKEGEVGVWHPYPRSYHVKFSYLRLTPGQKFVPYGNALNDEWSDHSLDSKSTMLFSGCKAVEYDAGTCDANPREFWRRLGSPSTPDAASLALESRK